MNINIILNTTVYTNVNNGEIKKIDEKAKRNKLESLKLISYVKDRLGHKKNMQLIALKIKHEIKKKFIDL